MEEDVFPDRAVAQILEDHFVEARLHTDGETNIQEILVLQRKLTGSLANPYFILQDPGTDEVLGKQAGYMGTSTFKEFLTQALP